MKDYLRNLKKFKTALVAAEKKLRSTEEGIFEELLEDSFIVSLDALDMKIEEVQEEIKEALKRLED